MVRCLAKHKFYLLYDLKEGDNASYSSLNYKLETDWETEINNLCPRKSDYIF